MKEAFWSRVIMRNWIYFLIFATLVIGPVDAQPAVPVAGQPKVEDLPTPPGQAKFIQLSADLHNKIFIEEYFRGEFHDEQWDEPVEALFGDAAKVLAAEYAPAFYKNTLMPNLDDALKAGNIAFRLGCQDPMFLYAYAVVLETRGEHLRARQFLGAIVPALDSKKQDPWHVLDALSRARQYRLDDQTQFALENRRNDAIMSLVKGPFLSGTHRRMALELFWRQTDVNRTTNADIDRLVRDIAALDRPDYWMRDMILGTHEMQIAWGHFKKLPRPVIEEDIFDEEVPLDEDLVIPDLNDEDEGNADDEDEEGMENGEQEQPVPAINEQLNPIRTAPGRPHNPAAEPEQPDALFAAHISAAQQRFERAIEIDPSLPEPYSQMIYVMGATGEDPTELFFEVLDLELDNPEAWDAMTWACSPQATDDENSIYELAYIARDTDRFDTLAPLQFVNVLQAAGKYFNDPWAPFKDDELWQDVDTVLKTYANLLGKEKGGAYYLSLDAGLAWRAGRLEKARTYVDILGFQLDFKALSEVDAMPLPAASLIYSMTSDVKDRVQRVIFLIEDERWAQANNVADATLKMLDNDVRARPILMELWTRSLWKTRFMANESVDLMPDAALTGWYVDGGVWKSQHDKLWGKGRIGDLGIRCMMDFGPRYELKIKMAFEGSQWARRAHASVQVGPALEPSGNEMIQILWDRPWYIYARHPHSESRLTPLEEAQSIELVIRAWDGKVTATANGVPVNFGPKNRLSEIKVNWESNQLVIGSDSDSDFHGIEEIRIDSIQVKKLAQP